MGITFDVFCKMDKIVEHELVASGVALRTPPGALKIGGNHASNAIGVGKEVRVIL